MKKYFFLIIWIFYVNISTAQLYERSGRNMGINAGYDYTSTHTSKKGFLPGEIGYGFRVGYMRTFGDFIYPGIIFNYRVNNAKISEDTLGNISTEKITTPSIQIPVLLQIPFVSIPLGKSKKRECTYLNTNFRIGPEFSYNLKSKTNLNYITHHEFALQTAFGFNVSKSGGTHRRQAWDVQWHIVWRKAFNQMGGASGFAGTTNYYNNYFGLTVTVIRYATTSFLP